MTALTSVGIVGAGQVGTMLGLALREAGAEVLLADIDGEVVDRSLELGAGHRSVEVRDVVDAETVILAVPVPAIVSLVEEIGPWCRPGSMLIDTGSTKRAVVEAMRRHVPDEVQAIGGHPMAGTERPGPDGARTDALLGAAFALTPVREDPAVLRRAEDLVRSLGSHPVVLDAETHDLVVARTSHLPHLVASALATAAAGLPSEPAVALAATGFADTTRLAGSHPSMVAGFLAANADQVRAALADLRSELEEAQALLDHPARLAAWLGRAGEARAEIVR